MEWLLRALLEFYMRKRHWTTKEELYVWLYMRARRRGEEPPRIESVLRYLRLAKAQGLVGSTPSGRIYIFPARIQARLNNARVKEVVDGQ